MQVRFFNSAAVHSGYHKWTLLYSLLLAAEMVPIVRRLLAGCVVDSENEASREEAAWDSQPDPVDLRCESALWMKQW